ncbi:MAG: relaxase/mobilization nuclease domain-containing protein [Lachnospiraceae bacterium]
MAISKILHMKQAKSGYMAKHLANGLTYIMDPNKTDNGRYVSGNNCIPENALAQMLDTKRHFGKLDKRQGYHLIISFKEEDLSEDTAFEIVGQFVEKYLGPDFEAAYAIHNDTEHVHGHIIFNSVRCTTGYKYDYKNGEWDRHIQPLVNQLCEEHKIAALDMEEVQKNRDKRKAGIKTDQKETGKKVSDRDARIKRDVDQAVRDSQSYEEFFDILRYMGYEIHGKKHLAVQEIGAERARRLDQFGEEYTQEMLRCRIAHPPVPEISEDEKKSEILYVFVPYRKRHLTRYQKEIFVRKYRVGKTKPLPEPWKYRTSLQALKSLQEEYCFWEKYQVKSLNQLQEIVKQTDRLLSETREDKRKLSEKTKSYQAVLDLWRQMEEGEMEARLYLEGYPEFQAEYTKYQELLKQLSLLGYSVSGAKTFANSFLSEKNKIQGRRNELLKEKRIALRLKEQIQFQREKKITIQPKIKAGDKVRS